MSDFDPFQHRDHRELVRAWIGARPSRSQTSLARRVGISRSFVAMVLAGERDLPLAAIDTWVEALELQGAAEAYFKALVRADSPLSLELRRTARQQAEAIRDHERAIRPTIEQARLLGLWFVPVVLELARSNPDFVLDPGWVAGKLWPPVELDEVAPVLEALVETGILRQEEGGVRVDPRPFASDVQLSDELSRIGKRYHRDQLEHALRALDEQGAHRRWVGSIAVAVEEHRLDELREALLRFQLEVIEPFRARDCTGAKVVQVGVQLFERQRED